MEAVKLEVRPMESEDLDAVASLESEVFKASWPRDSFEKELCRKEGAVYLVACEGELLLGYVGADIYGGEGYITNIAVREGHRRKGLGTALLRECARRSETLGVRWLTLEVRESNLSARRFYRSCGFRELGLRLRYYADSGENAIAMATGDIREVEFARAGKETRSRLPGRGGCD